MAVVRRYHGFTEADRLGGGARNAPALLLMALRGAFQVEARNSVHTLRLVRSIQLQSTAAAGCS